MEIYKNLGGNSNVIAFECGPDSIKVQFSDGSIYLYTSQSAGSINIATMQELAAAGRGLNGFINSVVKYKYASKLR